MANNKAFFIFTNRDTLKLQEVKSLKKMYKKNEILFFEVIDSEETVNILTLEETLNQYDKDLVNVDFISDKVDLIYSAYRIYQNHFQNFIYMNQFHKS